MWAPTFPHPSGLCTAALQVLREELGHLLQALSDDITGVSGARSGGNNESLKLWPRPPASEDEEGPYLRVSASLALGPCWVPDSSV